MGVTQELVIVRHACPMLKVIFQVGTGSNALRSFLKNRAYVLMLSALFGTSCSQKARSPLPGDYLVISHSALNRLTIFDLTAKSIVGALPAHKLPHDMVLSADKILLVVNSGSQCVSSYDFNNPELWAYARESIKKDSANLFGTEKNPSPNMVGNSHGAGSSTDKDTLAWTNLNRDPVQSLPSSFARTVLTDPHFPDAARPMHEQVNATSHNACYDCHDRSVGSKPFGLTYSGDSAEIFTVHLQSRDITFFDSKTLAIKRKIPLPLPVEYSPIEAWISPNESICFVTCRNEIGESKPGRILVLNLKDGTVMKSIQAGIYPWHIVADAAGKRLYINNFQSSRISIVDVAAREIVDSLVVQNGPSMMRILPESNVLVVSCFYTDKVLFVDLATKEITKIVDVDSNPTSLEFSQDRRTLYVLCGGESSLNIIDVPEGKVRERHPMLFGAYAFLSIHEK